MNFIIRPVKVEDAQAINEIRRMDEVMENMLGIPSERVDRSVEFLKNLSENDHLFVAEIQEETKKVVGLIGLHVKKSPRLRHSAGIGIMVHKDYQGQGIGTALMKTVIDLADNWLMLKRIELDVFVDNQKAIEFYKKFGFEVEGLKKYAAIRNGKYADLYIMARYNVK